VVKREARAEAVVIKEAAPTLTVCIVVAISTPRVREEWVEHGIVYLAKDGLEEPERIGEGGMVGPAKVEGLLREGYVALPAGIAGAATMPRPSRPWRWRWPDSSNVVCLAFIRIDKHFVCVVDLSEFIPCFCFLFLGDTIRVGL
jgi:hypothetical protein